jgi:enoyl-[acyl-carrier protein] reductase I
VLKGKRILIMGLLDTRSFAWAVGTHAIGLGAEVTYTVQNERFRDVLLRRSFKREGLNVDDYNILPCDVTDDDQIAALFERTGPIDGLVHSIGYARPETCLAENVSDAPREDVLKAFEISAASLAFVAREARKVLTPGSGIVALSFNSQQVFPNYNWMGICKAALETVAKYLARDLGPLGIRVNCISAGPQRTMAATHIPGFQAIGDAWIRRAPLTWDLDEDRHAVADAVLFLLSDLARRVTGEVLYVDSGFHIMGLERQPVEEEAGLES